MTTTTNDNDRGLAAPAAPRGVPAANTDRPRGRLLLALTALGALALGVVIGVAGQGRLAHLFGSGGAKSALSSVESVQTSCVTGASSNRSRTVCRSSLPYSTDAGMPTST